MSLDSDSRFTQVDPNDPSLWSTTVSSFGGPEDVASGQDNGEYAFGGKSVTPQGGIDPEPYLGLPADFFKSGAVKPGDKVLAINPKTGVQGFLIAKDIGPSAGARGADLAPHALAKLGLKTDEGVVLKFGADSPLGGGTAKDLSLGMIGQDETGQTEDSGQSLSGIGNDNSYYDAEEQNDVLPEEQDQTAQPAIEEEHSLSIDPSTLGEPTGFEPDGTVHYKGVSVLPSGFTKVNIGDGTTVTYDTDGKKVDVQHAPTPHYSNDPETGLPVASIMKDGKLVRVPTEFDDERAASEAMLKDGATGEDAIKDLPPRDQIIIKGYANYEKQPLAGSRNKEYNRLYPFIKAYNPDFQPQKYGTAQKILNEFNSSSPGVAGGQIVSVNTAIDHLGTLLQKAEALDNSKLRKYNSVANYLKSESGSPEVVAFNDAKNRVATEIARAFRGGVPTNLDIEESDRALSSANSPEQLAAVIKGTIPEMLNARLGEIGFNYESFFHKPFPGLVRPSAKRVLDAFGIKNFGGLEEGDQSSPESIPPPVLANGKTPTEGQSYTDPVTHVTKTWRNGQWE